LVPSALCSPNAALITGWIEDDVARELRALETAALATVRADAASLPLRARLEELLTVQFQTGRDQVEERYDDLRLHPYRRAG
jgi:hypothetical protein